MKGISQYALLLRDARDDHLHSHGSKVGVPPLCSGHTVTEMKGKCCLALLLTAPGQPPPRHGQQGEDSGCWARCNLRPNASVRQA